MAPSQSFVCLHTKNQLTLGVTGTVLPNTLLQNLENQNRGTYQGTPVHLLTERIAPQCGPGGVALAVCVDFSKLMTPIMALKPDAIVYIPWMLEEQQAYSALDGAQEI